MRLLSLTGLLAAILLSVCTATAQTTTNTAASDTAVADTRPLRPVLSAYTAEFGTAHLADTYLTPLRYSGWHSALHYQRMQAMAFSPDRWVMQLDGRLDVDHADNPARNATMWNAELKFSWTMMRRWQPLPALPALTVGIGPGIGLRAGVFYLARNSNNPASAKGAVTADARGYAAYSLRLGRLPVTLRYEGALPVTGAFFTPDYGQLYYEIWLGERSHLVRPAWWGNYFALDNRVTADLRFGGTTLRVGYSNSILSTKARSIVSRRITHALTIGIATKWLSLSSRQATIPDARIISALY